MIEKGMKYEFNDMIGYWFNGCDTCETCKYFHPELIECIFIEEIIQMRVIRLCV